MPNINIPKVKLPTEINTEKIEGDYSKDLQN